MKNAPSTGLTQRLPPLISYVDRQSLVDALRTDGVAATFEANQFESLLNADLPPLTSPTVMGLILGVSPKLITAMARSPFKYYRHFRIKKKSGGTRPISAPRTYIKAVQKFILKSILEKQTIPNYVMGFVKGQSIFHNARLHVGAKYLLNVDIENFFGFVKIEQVRDIFESLGYGKEMAHLLALLCTLGGSLPQGAPTSPCLANLAFRQVDQEIERLSTNRSFTYSRYADDLTFSAEVAIQRDFVQELRQILLQRGFRINEAKVRFARPGQALYVTGLVANEKPQPNRRTRRQLRAMFHHAAKDPRSFEKSSNALFGWASFVNSYDMQLAKSYLKIARLTERPPVSASPKTKGM